MKTRHRLIIRFPTAGVWQLLELPGLVELKASDGDAVLQLDKAQSAELARYFAKRAASGLGKLALQQLEKRVKTE